MRCPRSRARLCLLVAGVSSAYVLGIHAPAVASAAPSDEPVVRVGVVARAVREHVEPSRALALAPQPMPSQPVQPRGNPRRDSPTPDFMLGRPRSTIGLRASWLRARAQSDLYDFVRDRLTIGPRAFDGPGLAVDYAFALTPRVDLLGGIDHSRAKAASEYREFVDNSRRAIEQRTGLSIMNVTAGVRLHLTPRGREVSRLAWIPARATPYVSAGAGLVRHNLVQSGDFVDFETLRVFPDVFRSVAWAPTSYAAGGVNLNIVRGLSLATEGRYSWASAKLSEEFVGFAPLDLSGFRITGGINVVF